MKETGADRAENAVHMMTSIIVILAQKEGFTVKTASTITNVNNLKIVLSATVPEMKDF